MMNSIILSINDVLLLPYFVGTDGSLAYGPNSVISMVHHALQTHGLGEIDCCLHADSCGGN